ncbi:MAG: sigma-70 family RNA polymerase sigma factor [Hyphomicrobiales bacterium]|nr:sigma-70 family RNA polymerase sigma factor [Hyphomicrobiales bacterium]
MIRYQVPVLQFLQHRSGLRDAEDLLQETFVRAYVNLHRYRPRWRFATWLFTIARRVSINHRRRPVPVVDHEALSLAEAGGPTPLGAMVADEDRRSLWETAANVLGQEELTAVWLYYVEEMPTREIAAVLERSWVSVKTMLYRARRKLRPILEELESDSVPRSSGASAERQKARLAVEMSHVQV